MIRFCITPTLLERRRDGKNSNCELTHLPSFPLFPSQHETHKKPKRKMSSLECCNLSVCSSLSRPANSKLFFPSSYRHHHHSMRRREILLVMAFRLDGMDVCQKSITRHLRRYQPNDIGKQAYNFRNLSFIYTSAIIIIISLPFKKKAKFTNH